jgi:hypothetical protein
MIEKIDSELLLGIEINYRKKGSCFGNAFYTSWGNISPNSPSDSSDFKGVDKEKKRI